MVVCASGYTHLISRKRHHTVVLDINLVVNADGGIPPGHGVQVGIHCSHDHVPVHGIMCARL